jgi:hypothetical protein
MPKLDGTNLPSRLESRLAELRAGKEVAARDIRAPLSDEQIAEMDAAWAAQQELRKKRQDDGFIPVVISSAESSTESTSACDGGSGDGGGGDGGGF